MHPFIDALTNAKAPRQYIRRNSMKPQTYTNVPHFKSKPLSAVDQVRALISPFDPPGGPLSEEDAAGLLAGYRDVLEGRVSRLDLDSLPNYDDDEDE